MVEQAAQSEVGRERVSRIAERVKERRARKRSRMGRKLRMRRRRDASVVLVTDCPGWVGSVRGGGLAGLVSGLRVVAYRPGRMVGLWSTPVDPQSAQTL